LQRGTRRNVLCGRETPLPLRCIVAITEVLRGFHLLWGERADFALSSFSLIGYLDDDRERAFGVPTNSILAYRWRRAILHSSSPSSAYLAEAPRQKRRRVGEEKLVGKPLAGRKLSGPVTVFISISKGCGRRHCGFVAYASGVNDRDTPPIKRWGALRLAWPLRASCNELCDRGYLRRPMEP